MKIYDNATEVIIETKIKPKLKTIYNMRIQGFTDRQIAKVIGISARDFMRILDIYEEFKDVYEDATQLLTTELRNVVYQRALGTDNKTDKDGNLIGPDAGLAFKLLEKLDPAFSKKETTVMNVMSVEDVIRQIGKKRQEVIETKDEEEEHYEL